MDLLIGKVEVSQSYKMSPFSLRHRPGLRIGGRSPTIFASRGRWMLRAAARIDHGGHGPNETNQNKSPKEVVRNLGVLFIVGLRQRLQNALVERHLDGLKINPS